MSTVTVSATPELREMVIDDMVVVYQWDAGPVKVDILKEAAHSPEEIEALRHALHKASLLMQAWGKCDL